MFVINFKLDIKKVVIVCVFIALIVFTIVEFGTNSTSSVNANTDKKGKYDIVLNDENFTKMLKSVHDDINSNIGKTITLTGFVFKMPDFKDDYFVCGRNTIVNNEDAVAGFLCQSIDTKNLVDNEWVQITGVIIKGEYNGTMPIIKVGSMTKQTAPPNTYVDNITDKKANTNINALMPKTT
ncbi:MAG: hypothetical protein RSE57_02515 [Clostridia bacterium]